MMFTLQLGWSQACERRRNPEDSPETDLPRHAELQPRIMLNEGIVLIDIQEDQ